MEITHGSLQRPLRTSVATWEGYQKYLGQFVKGEFGGRAPAEMSGSNEGIFVVGPDGRKADAKHRPTRLYFLQQVKAVDKYERLVKGKKTALSEAHVFYFDVTAAVPMQRKLDIEVKLGIVRQKKKKA